MLNNDEGSNDEEKLTDINGCDEEDCCSDDPTDGIDENGDVSENKNSDDIIVTETNN